jgi:hypothetical protein
MIRDQEELLNSVYDKQIRSYFKEALDCYNTKAYKACVILSVIAGMDDLFKKIDMLSTEFNESQRSQFDDIRNKRNNSQPFERYLISFCNEDSFGILSRYEIKELEYCFDLRNSFAHPSEEECTAEKARYVFSVMIDLVSSKKMLGGYVYINSLINKIGGQFYYPTIDTSSIISITSNALTFVDDKKYVILLKKMLDKLRDEGTTNYEYFISTLINNIENIDELNRSIEPALSEGFIRYSSFEIIYSLHPNVFQKFDSANSQKMLRALLQQGAPKSLLCNIFQESIRTHKDLPVQLIGDIFENLLEVKDESCRKSYIISEELKRFFRILYEDFSKEYAIERIEDIITLYKTNHMEGVHFLISLLLEIEENTRKDRLLEILNEKIVSQTFSESNPAINDFCKLSFDDISHMSHKNIIGIFISILEASARGSYNAIPFEEYFVNGRYHEIVEDAIIDMKDEDFRKVYYEDSYIARKWKKIAEKSGDSNIKRMYSEYLNKKQKYEIEEHSDLDVY